MSLWEEERLEYVQAGPSREQDSFPFILPLSLDSDKILMWREQLLSLEDCFEAKKSTTFSSSPRQGTEHPVQCLCRDEVPSGGDEASSWLPLGFPAP